MSLGIGGLAGLGAGLLKSELIDRPRHQANVASRAIQARFAPLLGQRTPSFADLQAPDTAQTMLDFGLTGAAFGQQFGQNQPAKFSKQPVQQPVGQAVQQPVSKSNYWKLYSKPVKQSPNKIGVTPKGEYKSVELATFLPSLSNGGS